MKIIYILFLILLFTSCVTVHQTDLDAWQGAPVIELESHPVFNAMELKKQKLSDGSVLWSYTKRSGTYQNCSADTQTYGNTFTDSSNGHHHKYDRHGYDRYGYNRRGYDRYGYDRYGYNRRGYDRHGQHRSSMSNESQFSTSQCTTGEYVCVNQFLVNQKNIVEWYRPTGNSCYTNCSLRPASKPCTQ